MTRMVLGGCLVVAVGLLGCDSDENMTTDAEVAPTTSVTVDATGRLTFTTPLARGAEDCDPACDDVDGDGLNDAWEDALLEVAAPLVEFDDAEPGQTDDTLTTAIVGRVAKAPSDPSLTRVFIVMLWTHDYGWQTGTCVDFANGLAHRGDTERMILEFEHPDGTQSRLKRAYIAAHEASVEDASQNFAGATLNQLEFDTSGDSARLRVYAGLGKHGTFASKAACESQQGACTTSEECGADGVADRSAYQHLFPVTNAGEIDNPRLELLDDLGFEGEPVWSLDTRFCASLPQNEIGCAYTVGGMLTVDTFEGETYQDPI